ncbi:MAG: hypothetical protein CEE38_17150 [Planctomycetes bacterium B3_Pla]|nr:MAG: hypothetical protein CEE38_17150 [Planctomycetes bacterium B3_Pla]
MNWESIIKALGLSTVCIAAVAWVAKAIFSQLLSKDLEKFKSELNTSCEMQIEQFRSHIQLEAQKRVIEYSSLHTRRGELIADLYSRLSDLDESIQHLILKYQLGQYQEEITKEMPMIPTEIRTDLRPDEKKMLEKLTSANLEFWNFYKKKKIYFSTRVCDLVDRFSGLAFFLESNYENVTFKDGAGNILVNPKVQEVWDKASKTIPQLLSQLETEFRDILGVKSK